MISQITILNFCEMLDHQFQVKATSKYEFMLHSGNSNLFVFYFMIV